MQFLLRTLRFVIDVPYAAVVALQERGFDVQFIPEGEHARELYQAMNFVTLDDRKILMVRGVPQAKRSWSLFMSNV